MSVCVSVSSLWALGFVLVGGWGLVQSSSLTLLQAPFCSLLITAWSPCLFLVTWHHVLLSLLSCHWAAGDACLGWGRGVVGSPAPLVQCHLRMWGCRATHFSHAYGDGRGVVCLGLVRQGEQSGTEATVGECPSLPIGAEPQPLGPSVQLLSSEEQKGWDRPGLGVCVTSRRAEKTPEHPMRFPGVALGVFAVSLHPGLLPREPVSCCLPAGGAACPGRTVGLSICPFLSPPLPISSPPHLPPAQLVAVVSRMM